MSDMSRFLLGPLVVISVVAACSAPAVANITQNGSFESASVVPGGFITLASGSTAITGWQVTGDSIDYIGATWVASDGVRSLDLSGTAKGGIQQNLTTVPGVQYLVTFDLAGNPAGGPTVKTLKVSAGASTAQFTFDTTGLTWPGAAGNMNWITEQWSFVASDTTTTLSFESLDDTPYGPVLDNVSALAIPSPGAVLLAGIGTFLVGWLRQRQVL